MGYGEEEQQQQKEDEHQKSLVAKEKEIFNPYASRAPSDQAAQVRAALFAIHLPTEDNFMEWFPVLRASIDMVARVPGYDTKVYNELNRDMEDLVDRANSQGRRKIVASKMQKFVFKLRALVPKGDTPIVGMTGVTAMITTNVNQKQFQEVRMPVQPTPPQSLFSGVKQYLNRK
jgi:hypothetical protein